MSTPVEDGGAVSDGELPEVPALTMRERLRQLGAWHDEWAARQVAAGVDGPVPAGRMEGSDYNQHYADMEAPADAQDEFHRRAREIMGMPPL